MKFQKKKLNNKKLPQVQKKAKRGPYNKNNGPIFYYYSINNKVYKYTKVRKYEDYRCSCTAYKAKGK